MADPIQTGMQESQAGLGGIIPFTPPKQASVQDPAAVLKSQDLMKKMLEIASRQQFAGTPVPRPMEQMQDPNRAQQIGMNTAWPSAWGFQRFAAGIEANVKNAIAKQKNDQLLHYEGLWTELQADMNQLYTAQAANDPQGVNQAQTKLDSFWSRNRKELKKMAKALNQDWLNPEKTDVVQQAYKNVAVKTDQRAGAIQGLKDAFKKVLGQKQDLQQQLTDEQVKAMGREIQARAPTAGGTADPKIMIELQRVLGEQAHQQAMEGLEARGQDLRREELAEARKERHQEYVGNLEYKHEALTAHMQATAAQLAQTKISEADRKQFQQELIRTRDEDREMRREIAEEKLNTAGTPKERQTWVNNLVKELEKDIDVAKTHRLPLGIWGQEELDNAQERPQRLSMLSEDIVGNRISEKDATTLIYARLGPGYELKKGPDGVWAYYQIGAKAPQKPPSVAHGDLNPPARSGL